MKITAGKIIPAVATTTAFVVGCVALEIVKHFFNKKIENMRNVNGNLGVAYVNFNEPDAPKQNKDKKFDPVMQGPVIYVP